MSASWTHNALASDLAGHLCGEHRCVWENLQLGPSGSIRPDVYTLEKSFAYPAPVAYEVKISRADLLRDLSAGKWIAYRSVATAVYFAIPVGLARRNEFPAGVGIYQRSETGWSALRRATREPVMLSEDTLLKLIIDGLDLHHGTTWGSRRRELLEQLRAGRLDRKRFGERVARIMADQDAAETAAKDALVVAESARKVAEDKADELRRVALADVTTFCREAGLRLPETNSAWAFGRQIREQLEALSDRSRIARVRREVEWIAEKAADALKELGEPEEARRTA